MAGFRTFLKAGHSPTLLASFVYFTYCCGVWVTNGAMAPFIKDSLRLSPAQLGVMLSVPIFAGALMRFPLGILAQYIGRKNATLVEMGGIAIALLFGYFFVDTFNDLLAMGVLLGIAGASFGVALSLGSGSFPARYKGLAMGLVGAGNVGTSLSALLAPQLAQAYGWKAVYGLAALGLLIPVAVMIVFAREPDDVDKHAGMREHTACLFEKDGWAFSAIYAITFGGFIGLATFLPSYYYDQFGVSKVQAGQLTMLAAFMGAALRIFGGWISDHWGGINTLTAVLAIIAVTLLACGMAGGSLVVTTLLMMLCFAALGAGNGALFQLVPLRWPLTTAVAGSMIGEIGALGGGLVPNAMGLSRQYTGTYFWGFALFSVLALCALGMMRFMQIRWTRTWAEKGGRARSA
ncbi:MFS transporter [Hydrogenophaga sp. PBL-H3]|uniref:MFS transporter n=1 Tax=Hydrogenophaga sp. PBL-H3 TaxID=434010 RepID=UPI00131F644C|nr:MFS transporter [Hydrogenophaga sp. PBL-H3]QHE76012.1 NarK/NasA family nitrate transporter [Hydrogenophaga sp. PBL-H3]QHE80436.1 NarK/NasA family nitrate transporter [Hydrogenophaga sp. PBL-H3]